MGLRENIKTDSVEELAVRDLIAVGKSATVLEAVELMRKRHLGCVIVVDSKGKPIGKFTERQLLKLLLSNASMDTPISKVMYDDPNAISIKAPIQKMVELMETRRLRFICVVDEKGKAVGLSGQKGLMEYIAEFFPRQVKAQLMEKKLSMSQREGA
jgi:CBS domain-containing protein